MATRQGDRPMSESATALVEQLRAAGEWPEPKLLEEIVVQGNEAVEPLREVLRRDLHGWPEEAPLVYAIDLLGRLQVPAAVPDMLAILRRYDNETIEGLPAALAAFGAE